MRISIFSAVIFSIITMIFGFLLSDFIAKDPLKENVYLPSNKKQEEKRYLTTTPIATHKVEAIKNENHATINNFKNMALQLVRKERKTLNKAMLEVVIAQWAQDDWRAALHFSFVKEPISLVNIVISIASEQQNKEILEWLGEHSSHRQYNAWLELYFQHFTSDESHEMLSYINDYPHGKIKTDVINRVVNIWASKDIIATLDWLEQNIDGAITPSPYVLAMHHYIEQSPWAAANAIKTLPFEADQGRLTSKLADRLSKEDIYKAINWAESLPPEQELKVMAQIISNWAASDTPDLALNYLLSRTDMQSNNEVFQSTIANIAGKDPQLLMDRLPEFSEDTKIDVITHVSANMARKNEAYEYEFWLNSLPIGGMRAAASLAGVEANMYVNPATAFKLAENLIDSNQRLYYLKEAAKAWSGIDTSQARFAVKSTDTLTEEQKVTLLSNLPF